MLKPTCIRISEKTHETIERLKIQLTTRDNKIRYQRHVIEEAVARLDKEMGKK